MEYTKTGIKDFNLEHIFDCGQCFRWERQDDGSYTGAAMGKIVNMRFEPEGRLTVDNCTEEEFTRIWTPYLDLERDYAKIKCSLQGEEIQRAMKYGYGIRILKQDFWEALLSFIISQNNNIPRIKGCIEALTRCCGEKIGTYKGKDHYALPEPETLANMTPDKLAECRLGYRGPYLIKTAQKVLEKGGADAAEKELRNCETFEEVQEALREYPGVGPKVASCTALFGLGFLDAFPIDVWMRRVMHRLYGMDEKDVRSMEDFAKKNFAPYGGIAQQYLFYYIRGLH
ncbi:MAG: 8-oxoguanine DNA glycosylase [Firmicutes bacterium]|nr:8-oxoguanine DNA glycosylase [Bacillota bacterium]